MRADVGIARHREPSPVQIARIQRELSGAPPREPIGPQPGYEYLTTQQVIALLHCSIATLRALGLQAVKCGPRGSGSRGRRPWLYRREHIERVLLLRRVACIPYYAAARIVVAEIEGRL